jgi:transposase
VGVYRIVHKAVAVELIPECKYTGLIGIYNKDNVFYPFPTEGVIDSQFVIDALDTFSGHIVRPSVVLVDNAPMHTSELFMDRIKGWMEKDLYIFYLPKYSPHLNKIETLWRFIKYEWIKIEAYASWDNLVKNLKEIFDQIGGKYRVNFT